MWTNQKKYIFFLLRTCEKPKRKPKLKCFIGWNWVHCFTPAVKVTLVLHVAAHVFRQLLQEQHGADLSPGSFRRFRALVILESAASPTCFTDCCSAKKLLQLLQRHRTVCRFGWLWSRRRCCTRCSLMPKIREQFCHCIRWVRREKNKSVKSHDSIRETKIDRAKRSNPNPEWVSPCSGSSSSSWSLRLVCCHHCSLCKAAGDKRTSQHISSHIWHTWASRASIPHSYAQSCTSPRHCDPRTLADSHVTIRDTHKGCFMN